MELCSLSPNLAGSSQANGAMLRLLRARFRSYKHLVTNCVTAFNNPDKLSNNLLILKLIDNIQISSLSDDVMQL